MNNKATRLLVFPFMVISLVSCSHGGSNLDGLPEFAAHAYIDYQAGMPKTGFMISDGWSNSKDKHGTFGVSWSSSQVNGNPSDGLVLTLEKTEDLSKIKNSDGEEDPTLDHYLGGELRSNREFKYGFFGAYLKPSNVKGTVSTFFLYTGPTDGNPHDEIDVEFLGKDTTRVQFNYYSGNDQGHEHWYNLGFDASEDYHHYGFYYDSDEIIWYIDFVPVFRYAGIKAPSHGMKLFNNFWKASSGNRNATGWAGSVNDADLPTNMYIKSLTYANTEGKPTKYLPEYEEYDTCPAESLFSAAPAVVNNKSGEYVVSTDEQTKAIDVTYSAINAKTYKNLDIGFGEQTQLFKDSKYVRFDVENKGTTKAKFRFTVNIDGSTFIELKNAWVDGDDTKVSIEDRNTLSYFTIQAGQKATFTGRYYGLDAAKMYFMIDSTSRDADDEQGAKSGHIVLSNFRLGGIQDYEEVIDDIPEEIDPESGDLPDPLPEPSWPTGKKIDTMYTFGSSNGYTFTGHHVEYDVPASNKSLPLIVKNASEFDVAGILAVYVKIKNNNAHALPISINYKNDSGTVSSGGSIFYSMYQNSTFDRSSSSNGEYFTVGPFDTAIVKIDITTVAPKIRLLANMTGSEALKGSFDILDWKTYVKGEPDPEGLTLNFVGNEEYTIVNEENKSTVTYASITSSTYKNINADIASLVGDCNTFEFDYTNKSEFTSKFEVGVGDGTGSFVSYLLSTTSCDWYNEGDSRAQFSVGPNETRHITLVFDNTKTINMIMMFVDSTWESSEIIKTNGEIELSNFTFEQSI